MNTEDFLNSAGKNVKLVLPEQKKADPVKPKKSATQAVKPPKQYVALDRILVKPIEPARESSGGIALAKQSVLSEIALTTIGQIIGMGPSAYTAITSDGVDFSKGRVPKVGDWITYRKHAGQPQLLKHKAADRLDAADSPRLLLMQDNDVLSIFESEEEARKVWGWIG
jgi:co-chaperonin GroES (HSP10)